MDSAVSAAKAAYYESTKAYIAPRAAKAAVREMVFVYSDGTTDVMKIGEPFDLVLIEVLKEYSAAIATHPRFNSAHEGFAVIDEERDELWDEVKKNPKYNWDRAINMHEEAKQLAAMALRFMVEIAK